MSKSLRITVSVNSEKHSELYELLSKKPSRARPSAILGMILGYTGPVEGSVHFPPAPQEGGASVAVSEQDGEPIKEVEATPEFDDSVPAAFGGLGL